MKFLITLSLLISTTIFASDKPPFNYLKSCGQSGHDFNKVSLFKDGGDNNR